MIRNRKIGNSLKGFNRFLLQGFICLSIAVCPFVFTYGQTLFNIIPEIGSDKNQGVCRAVICSDSLYYIIGHRLDSVGSGSDVKPWFGQFDYEGNLSIHVGLKDTISSDPFYANTVLYALKDQNHAYVYVKKVISGHYYTPILVELNLPSGRIVKSKQFPNSLYPDLKNGQGYIIQEHDTIFLLSFVFVNDSIKSFITLVDSLFNVVKIIEVQSPEKEMVPHFFSLNDDNTFTIIGDMRKEENGKICNYFLNVDDSGSLISFHTPDVGNIYSFLFSDNRSVIENEDNWVLFVHKVIPGPDSCTPCLANIPYMYSIQKNSDSVLWETKMFNIPFRPNPAYSVNALTQLEDGYIGAGDYIKHEVDELPSSGVLFKTSLTGVSLWIKHYIPLNWQDDRVFWATFKALSPTPFGTIIAAGEVSDKDEFAIKPWIIHVDKDGCLVPGCEIVGMENIPSIQEIAKYFKIYPNPASSELYFLALEGNLNPYRLQLISPNGILLHQVDFQMTKGYQYMVSLEELPAGLYQLVFTDKTNSKQEIHSFIKI